MKNNRVNAIEMYVNNGRIMQIAQHDTDDEILLTTYNGNSGIVDYELSITPGDMVMLINYYCHQKENGLSIF